MLDIEVVRELVGRASSRTWQRVLVPVKASHLKLVDNVFVDRWFLMVKFTYTTLSS